MAYMTQQKLQVVLKGKIPMEHGFDISTNGVMVLPEVEEDTNQGWAQNWTRREILVQTATLVTEGAIEDETD